jgi:hypothetical protein
MSQNPRLLVLTRMSKMRSYLDHGVLELDNNSAKRAMRCVVLGRKNYLFVSSEGGGKAAAIAYTLIETAKLNCVDPQAGLTHGFWAESPITRSLVSTNCCLGVTLLKQRNWKTHNPARAPSPDVCGRPGECKWFFGLILAM